MERWGKERKPMSKNQTYLHDGLELAMLGFKPCPDADLRNKVADGYGEGYVVMSHGEDNSPHIFEIHNNQYQYIQSL